MSTYSWTSPIPSGLILPISSVVWNNKKSSCNKIFTKYKLVKNINAQIYHFPFKAMTFKGQLEGKSNQNANNWTQFSYQHSKKFQFFSQGMSNLSHNFSSLWSWDLNLEICLQTRYRISIATSDLHPPTFAKLHCRQIHTFRSPEQNPKRII